MIWSDLKIKWMLTALYDGYKLTYEKLESLEERVTNIDDKVEQQDVEIRVIRSVK